MDDDRAPTNGPTPSPHNEFTRALRLLMGELAAGMAVSTTTAHAGFTGTTSAQPTTPLTLTDLEAWLGRDEVQVPTNRMNVSPRRTGRATLDSLRSDRPAPVGCDVFRIIFGGEVRSSSDGQVHYVDSLTVAVLLGIRVGAPDVTLVPRLADAISLAQTRASRLNVYVHGPSVSGSYNGDEWVRAGYLRSGMSRAEYAQVLAEAAINLSPSGEERPGRGLAYTSPSHVERVADITPTAIDPADWFSHVATEPPPRESKAWQRIKAKGCIGRQDPLIGCTDYGWGCEQCPAKPEPTPHATHQLGRLVRMKLIAKK